MAAFTAMLIRIAGQMLENAASTTDDGVIMKLTKLFVKSAESNFSRISLSAPSKCGCIIAALMISRTIWVPLPDHCCKPRLNCRLFVRNRHSSVQTDKGSMASIIMVKSFLGAPIM